MIFETITPAEFTEFAKSSPYKSFMQTEQIAKLRAKSGWTAYFLGVRATEVAETTEPTESQNTTKPPKVKATKAAKSPLLAAVMLVSKPTFFGKSTFLAPGGPLLDLEDEELATFFFTQLKQFVKSHNGLTLHISPYYELIERDRHGEIVPDGFNHQTALGHLTAFGFKSIDSDQPKYLFALDVKDSTVSELFANFKQNTRNLIHRSERQGVKIRELKREDLKVLKEITAATADRRHFSDRPLEYYENMYDLFAKTHEVKFLLAEAEIDGQLTPLSVAMFMLYGDEVVYLFSGSDEKYMKTYSAQYLIQWHMIKYAAEHGFARYNFYGIRGLPDPASKDYGIYGFKKGFGGHVVELIGSFELPVSPLVHLYRILSRLKKLARK